MEWTIHREEKPGAQLEVHATGELDLYEAPQFASALIDLISKGTLSMLIDFNEVDYMDSTGVGVIIRIIQQMKSRGGTLLFRGIHGTPRKVLEMSNVINLMQEADRGANQRGWK